MASMLYCRLIVLVLILNCASFAQKTGPITLTPENASPEQKAKLVDMSCPIKDTFTVNYKKVGGAVVDKDYVSVTGTARYCQRVADLAFCNKNNPTPQVPCKLIDPLLPRFSCPLTFQDTVSVTKNKGFGPWEVDNNTNIFLKVFTCDRAYKMDSCRYWHQSAAVSKFKNAGLFSVERKTTAEFNACELDAQAEAAFQAKLPKEREKLAGLIQIKRGLWDAKCPKDNKQCRAKVTELGVKAQLEADQAFIYSFDGDAAATMKFITQKHDPIVDAAVKAFK